AQPSIRPFPRKSSVPLLRVIPYGQEVNGSPKWRDAESAFLSLDLIKSGVEDGVIVRQPEARPYFGFVDAAGGAGSDSFTAAITHRHSTNIILDAVYEKQPPFSPQSTTEEIAAFFKQYRISRITGDRYAGDWPASEFRRHGISYESSKLSRSEIYVETIP